MALALGIEDVDAMLRRIPAKKFRRWQLYEELEPFGERRADFRAALIAQTIFNMAVAKKDRLPLKDFVLPTGEGEEEKPRQTPDQQLALLKIMATIQAASPETTPIEKRDDKQAAGLMEQLERARAAMQ